MAEFGSGLAVEAVKCSAKGITSQLRYLKDLTRNINNLTVEEKKLDNEIKVLQLRVKTAKEAGQIILPTVNDWLIESDGIKAQITEIVSKAENVGCTCSSLRDRISLSKRAKETTDLLTQLLQRGKLELISNPPPAAATQQLPGGEKLDFESRSEMEEAIMTTLRDRNVKRIGIYGMGGLGKTTMAERIRNRVLTEKLFDEVPMAVVSQQADTSKIQVDIGKELGLNDLKDATSRGARIKLNDRLSDGTKRSLFILDDVWEGLELEDLGIPKGCTILITSRNEKALSEMGCKDENRFGMKILSEEEAWCLFKEGAGTCVDDPNLNPIAREVAQECKGLPLALKALGRALNNTKKASWDSVLRELKEGTPPDIQKYIDDVYAPLIISYNLLDSQMAKSVFLLCCLFPEDSDIPLDHLTYFSMGLGIFEGIRKLKDARIKMCHLIDEFLKSRSLLLDSDEKDHVRIHDVFRDVCIYLAKQKGFIGDENRAWISSSQHVGIELLSKSTFPNLRLLSSSEPLEEFEFGSAFLEGIEDLYVLCIENWRSLTSVPPTTSSLVNLKTLLLDSCPELKTISVVGKLRNLEILICRNCESIEELPLEMKELKRLKLLDLTRCGNLQSIGRGIISSLIALEELKMLESFDKWEAVDSDVRENAALSS